MRFILILLINIILQNNIFGKEPFIKNIFDHLATNRHNHIKCIVTYFGIKDICTLSAKTDNTFTFTIEYSGTKIIIDFKLKLNELPDHYRFYYFNILRSIIYNKGNLITDNVIDVSQVVPEYENDAYTLIFPFKVETMHDLATNLKSKLFLNTNILSIIIPHDINSGFFDQILETSTIISRHVIISDHVKESSDDMHLWNIPEVKSYDILDKIINHLYHSDLCVETSEYCFKKNQQLMMRYVFKFHKAYPETPAPYILVIKCKDDKPCLFYNGFHYKLHVISIYKVADDDTVYVLDNDNPKKTWLTYSQFISEYNVSGELEYIRTRFYYIEGGNIIYVI